ncbi:MAG: peptide chain release factor N(5)-glutamine methyltransferase [Alphaproteobacteria bacterium]|nr:peptide chain release factor N(5)-glutamine methyltransferase [Alphaproteobacteria bacterium]
MNNIGDFYKKAAAALNSPHEARILIAHFTGGHNPVLHPQIPLAAEQLAALEAAVARRQKHEPVSKIIGSKPFWRDSFITTKDTLDPRPETELLVQAVVDRFDKTAELKILDLGTGTGCVLISLLKHFPAASGVGVDISQPALAIAVQNSENLGTADRAQFMNADITGPLPLGTKFDIIVANPPYIKTADIQALMPDVRDFDPHSALDGGADGLDFYRIIPRIILPLCHKRTCFFCEVGYNQSKEVQAECRTHGLIYETALEDLNGIQRVLIFSLMD